MYRKAVRFYKKRKNWEESVFAFVHRFSYSVSESVARERGERRNEGKGLLASVVGREVKNFVKEGKDFVIVGEKFVNSGFTAVSEFDAVAERVIKQTEVCEASEHFAYAWSGYAEVVSDSNASYFLAVVDEFFDSGEVFNL